MDRKDVLKRLLYPKCKSAIEFQFDTLMVNPLLSYITPQDIYELNKIATSIKYSSKPKEKYAMIDKILAPRGFKKMASGTNRVVYRFLEDYRIVLKVAIDKVGLSDNGNEYRNQHLLKPFVTKCFEVSPCGTVGLFERVNPITSREEFINISEDVFDLVNNLIGKYVLEDIGEKYYMNYGLREGFGPVLLDYPYVFELDGRKLICNVPEPMNTLGYCGGEIDYDIGYNDLRCKRCGKRYLATELKSEEKSDKPKIIIKGDDLIMRCVLMRGDEVISELNSKAPIATNTIKSRREVNKLRATVSTEEVAEEKENYRPTIKTHDDVKLKVEVCGRRKSPNVDKIAIEKEEKLEKKTPSIEVSFGNIKSTDQEEPVSLFSAMVERQYREIPSLKSTIVEVKEEVIEEPTVEENVTEEVVVEESTEEEVEIPEVKEGWSIGELIGDKMESFVGNENYKTDKIVSPIKGHYAKEEVEVESVEEENEEVENTVVEEVVETVSEEVIEEETVEETVSEEVVEEETTEEEVEIPELIIHPRKEESEDESESDEEYESVDEDSEDSEESGDNINLY